VADAVQGSVASMPWRGRPRLCSTVAVIEGFNEDCVASAMADPDELLESLRLETGDQGSDVYIMTSDLLAACGSEHRLAMRT